MTLFPNLLHEKKVNREDFYTLWLIAKQNRTEDELTTLLAVSIRTVQRSLARLRQAGLVAKVDRVAGLWAIKDDKSIMTNLTLQTNTKTHTTNTLSSGKGTPQAIANTHPGNYLVGPGAPVADMAVNADTSGQHYVNDDSGPLGRLACELLNIPFSRRVANQLAKIPNASEEIITEAAEITKQEVLNRKPGYAPLKNPVGYFLMVVSRKCQQLREIQAIKQKAQAELSLGQATETTGGKTVPAVEPQAQEQEARILLALKAQLEPYVVYFNPAWSKYMLKVIQQILPVVSEADIITTVKKQLHKKPEIAVQLATKPWVLGDWMNRHRAATEQAVPAEELTWFGQEIFYLLRSRCNELSVPASTTAIYQCAVTVSKFLATNSCNFTTLYYQITDAKPTELTGWIANPAKMLAA